MPVHREKYAGLNVFWKSFNGVRSWSNLSRREQGPL